MSCIYVKPGWGAKATPLFFIFFLKYKRYPLSTRHTTQATRTRSLGVEAWEKQPRSHSPVLCLYIGFSCVADSFKCGMERNVVPGDGLARTGRVISGSAHSAQARPPSPTHRPIFKIERKVVHNILTHMSILWPGLGELSRALPNYRASRRRKGRPAL